MNPELAHLIGIEIGRVHSRIVITNLSGSVLWFKKFRSELSRDEGHFLSCIHNEIRDCLRRDKNIQGIGIAHSGVIDHATGTVLFWPKIEGWHDVPLKQIFQRKYDIALLLEDSARTTAIAEQRFGYGIGQTNFIFVHAGVGIGAAIFVDRELYSGHDGIAGELGHTTINAAGPRCSCGNRGCLEVYASGSAIIENVRAGIEQGVASSLARVAGNPSDNLSIESIVAAAESHDRLCETVLTEAGTHLGTALAGIANLLNPARIVLGGTLPQAAKTMLMDPLLRSLRDRAFQRSLSRLEVEVSKLGEEAAALGACLLIGERILMDMCAAEIANEKPIQTRRRSAP